MIARFMSVTLVTALAGCAPPTDALSSAPGQTRARVQSTGGYSILPPQGSGWSEQFGKSAILYDKKTDMQDVTFYAGALERNFTVNLPNKAALVAYARSEKNAWGDDGRFVNISSTFIADADQESCVRYRLSAHDTKAKNKGSHEFLVMIAVGRFCLHPQDRTAAVDVYYSVRYAPGFDPRELMAEGEEFLKGLQFSNLPAQSAVHGR